MGEHAAWIAASSAADVGVSAWALESCATCREANPLLPDSVGGIVAVKLAGSVLAIGACQHFERRGRKDVARGIRWGWVAVSLGAAAYSASRGGRR